jgi:glycosyltransferase involved in cell wall biosynthesis
MKLSIIIPAYNEARTIEEIVARVLAVAYPLDYELIIVDDHSKDGTDTILAQIRAQDKSGRVTVLRNPVNQGKGYSIQKGLEVAQGDIAVVQDADFEYDPSEIPKLVEPILKGEKDVVYGSRFLSARRPSGMAFPNYIANVFLTAFTNVLFGSRLTDMETCYKVVRMSVLRTLELNSSRFDFEPEITTKLLKKKVAILELPISYHGRTSSEGKKIKARDFFIALRVLLKNRLEA